MRSPARCGTTACSDPHSAWPPPKPVSGRQTVPAVSSRAQNVLHSFRATGVCQIVDRAEDFASACAEFAPELCVWLSRSGSPQSSSSHFLPRSVTVPAGPEQSALIQPGALLAQAQQPAGARSHSRTSNQRWTDIGVRKGNVDLGHAIGGGGSPMREPSMPRFAKVAMPCILDHACNNALFEDSHVATGRPVSSPCSG